jgi:indolepyruvate ferredoxin oxidoreductase alpha subunit
MYGSKIGGVMGMEKARGANSQQIGCGYRDSTFVHSGITPLIDIVYNQATSTVIILDNDTTAMTGHQEHPATGRTIKGEPTMKLDIKALARAVGVKNVRVVDPLNLKQVQETIKEELERREPSVIVAERPCALLVKEPPREKYYVDKELCKGCKLCIRLGCTGISWLENEKIAVINPNSCVSCGLCPQVCTFDAVKVIQPEK